MITQTTYTTNTGVHTFQLPINFAYESDEQIMDRYRFMDAWPDIKKAARKVEWL
jgi:hypothetical protein